MSQLYDFTYPIEVDYNVSLEKLIKDGNYSWINEHITSKNFPTKNNSTSKLIMKLIEFTGFITEEEILYSLNQLGCRPAEIYELISLGLKYPDIQRKILIVSIGSKWKNPDLNQIVVPILGTQNQKRILSLEMIASVLMPLSSRRRFATIAL